MEGWCEGGQIKKLNNRCVSVKTRGLALTAIYPVFNGNNENEIDRYCIRHSGRTQEVSGEGNFHRGEDFNAHVGEGDEIEGIKGKFGLRQSNERGRGLLRWCQENNLAYVNSYFDHK